MGYIRFFKLNLQENLPLDYSSMPVYPHMFSGKEFESRIPCRQVDAIAS